MNGIPKTIEELQQWYIDRNLPQEEVTRFFIGKNYEGPKAFGIYKDELTGEFIVYKNKANGDRAIRYQGKDEEKAVRELYLKLKEEIGNQKSNNRRTSGRKSSSFSLLNLIPVGLMGIVAAIIGITAFFTPQRGYYSYKDNYYYYQNGSWYEYFDVSGWNIVDEIGELKKDYKEYFMSEEYMATYDATDFSISPYYQEPTVDDSDSDWSSSDSWDSGSTDWDSDW